MEYLKNTSYFFLPFSFQAKEPQNSAKAPNYAALKKALLDSAAWEKQTISIRYLLKYVADKIESKDKGTDQCSCCMLKESAREQYGLGAAEDWFATDVHPFRHTGQPIRFRILDVRMFFFSTTVGMFAFRIHFEQDDPFWVANAQYYLKKVSVEKFRRSTGGPEMRLLGIAQSMATDLEQFDIDLFYYANKGTERANIFTFLETEQKQGPLPDYREELFYLRRCYGENFIFNGALPIDRDERMLQAQHGIWGISPEATVFLAAFPDRERKFVESTFYKNFNSQYLFMYVLLLHEKYMLYLFMSRINIGTYQDLQMLEDYQNQLSEFETDFVFACVSEVPQYQNLYEQIVESFALQKMYQDVRDPLASLEAVRRKEAMKVQAAAADAQIKREGIVNKALFMISFLSLFSALIDSFDFGTSFFGMFMEETGVLTVQICCIVVILVLVGIVVKFWIESRRLNRDQERERK